MNRFLLIITLVVLNHFSGFSQERINDYKYVIIPIQYEFQKSEDQYQLNSLTKFLFNKYGFTAYMENENLPNDYLSNRCLGLIADVKKVKGGFLNTKIQIDLLDCKDQVIASSVIGKSKEKVYEKAYNIAIREAFKTFQYFDYKYMPNPSLSQAGSESSSTQEKEIERLKKEVQDLKENSKSNTETLSEETNASAEEPVTESSKTISVNDTEHNSQKDMLYAQPIEGGFQVVDTEPKTVMVLLRSGLDGHFIVKGKDAVVYKKGSSWILAEHNGKTLITKEIQLKF